MDEDVKEIFLNQLKKDLNFLRLCNIIDYSILIGIAKISNSKTFPLISYNIKPIISRQDLDTVQR